LVLEVSIVKGGHGNAEELGGCAVNGQLAGVCEIEPVQGQELQEYRILEVSASV